MSKQEIIDQKNKQLNEIRQYATDLKARHDVLINEVAELAQGIGASPCTWTANNHQEKMEHKAANALKRIAKMSLRECTI